eukprot:gene3353-639_t
MFAAGILAIGSACAAARQPVSPGVNCHGLISGAARAALGPLVQAQVLSGLPQPQVSVPQLVLEALGPLLLLRVPLELHREHRLSGLHKLEHSEHREHRLSGLHKLEHLELLQQLLSVCVPWWAGAGEACAALAILTFPCAGFGAAAAPAAGAFGAPAAGAFGAAAPAAAAGGFGAGGFGAPAPAAPAPAVAPPANILGPTQSPFGNNCIATSKGQDYIAAIQKKLDEQACSHLTMDAGADPGKQTDLVPLYAYSVHFLFASADLMSLVEPVVDFSDIYP